MLAPEYIVGTNVRSIGQVTISADTCFGTENALRECADFLYDAETTCDFEEINAVLCSSTDGLVYLMLYFH